MKEYLSTLHLILQGYNSKKLFIIIPLKKKKKILLSYLVELGFIKAFFEKNGNFKVLLKYNNGNPALKQVVYHSTALRPAFMSSALIKKQQTTLKSATQYLILTSDGFLTHSSILKNNTGGILLAQLS